MHFVVYYTASSLLMVDKVEETEDSGIGDDVYHYQGSMVGR